MPDVGGIAGDHLRSFIERIERLEEEKKTIAHDIKEVYAEAKGTGFDTKIMRLLIKERRMDKDDLDEQETLLDVYRRALGMLADTPLGEAAIETAIIPGRSLKARVGQTLVEALGNNEGDDVELHTGGRKLRIRNKGSKKTVEHIDENPVPA